MLVGRVIIRQLLETMLLPLHKFTLTGTVICCACWEGDITAAAGNNVTAATQVLLRYFSVSISFPGGLFNILTRYFSPARTMSYCVTFH